MEFRSEFRAYFPVAWICIPTDRLLLFLVFFFVRNLCRTIFFTWNLSIKSLTLQFRNAPMFVVDLKRYLTWYVRVCWPDFTFSAPVLVTAIRLKAKGRYYGTPLKSLVVFEGPLLYTISGPLINQHCCFHLAWSRACRVVVAIYRWLKSIITYIGITHIQKLVNSAQLVQQVKCRAADLQQIHDSSMFISLSCYIRQYL
jgi:hypothetical protein